MLGGTEESDTGQVGTGEATDLLGDDASPPSPGGTDGGRQARVAAAAKAWTGQLVDLSGRNTLLYYKDLRQGTLDLRTGRGRQGTLDLSPEHGDEPDLAVSDLLASRSVRLSILFRDDLGLAAAAKRARTILAKAQENYEERGLQTLFLAWGMATWENTRGTATPAAPVLLRQAHLSARGGAGEDFDLGLPGEWEVNPTLLHLLRTEYQVELDADDLLDHLTDDDLGAPDATELWRLVTKASAGSVPGFGITDRVVLGNFSYAKLPMVEDIRLALEQGLLEAHDLLSAIAGDQAARSSVRSRYAEVGMDQPDRVLPADEFLVLDADASQSYAINAVVAGSDLVVEGPPGTGKSQTIANLIATLAARRQRVLFVAEKRAAIDAVLDRLNRVGLGDLVLDLHDGAGNKRKLAQGLAKAMADHASIALPDLADDHADLVRERSRLVGRAEALHTPRDPWDISVYELQSRLLALPATAHTSLRLARPPLNALDNAARSAARDDLRSYVELGGLTLGRGLGSPWATAIPACSITSPNQAAAALDAARQLHARTLPETSQRLEQMLSESGLAAPDTIEGWAEVLRLLDGVAATLAHFEPEIYSAALDDLVTALEPATGGPVTRFFARLGNGAYRRARKQARGLWRGDMPASADLHAAVTQAQQQLAAWQARSVDGGNPRLPTDQAGSTGSYDQLGRELGALSAYLGGDSLVTLTASDLRQRLDALLADQVTLQKLPELHRRQTALNRYGLTELTVEASDRNLDAAGAVALFDHLWLSSVLDAVSFGDRLVGAFDGATHHRVVADYQDDDHQHIDSGPVRVRRAVAEWAVETRDAHPEQSDVIEHQARLKRRHLPVRQLFQAAPDALGAMKPCWAMSPLVVAQLLPAEQCFDVVIFDEASQVTPADAVGALLRARRAVVAGDTKQLPPTTFFSASGGGEEDEEDEEDAATNLALTTGLESVLDVMAALLPPPRGTRTLDWHYRSRDERLIAFSNAQPSLYDWSMTTFPGVAGGDCLQHVHVPWRPGRAGQEESVGDEVTQVAELIIAHARQRPDESLGVIAMGLKHANRITESVRRARADDPELDHWLAHGPDDRDGSEPFFVKNLERVQGDERDAVLLTIGYGKSADGRMLYRFGPINTEGGERRLNVAVTRARNRMTVVSSFAAADLDPNRLRAEGAKMLGRYLAYAESGGTSLGEVAHSEPTLNPFERDVRDKLTAAGIPVVPRFGCSGYRIDFAAQHPTHLGRMVLAIESDGASYHSSATARDRDRLRQEHLERLGWTFHRIWSTDWFRSHDSEIARAFTAYQAAVDAADGRHTIWPAPPATSPVASGPLAPGPAVEVGSSNQDTPRQGRPPYFERGASITQHDERDLIDLVRWIESDTLLRTEEEVLAEAMDILGYRRRGNRIIDTLTQAIRTARGSQSS